jgi:hypothetical protein
VLFAKRLDEIEEMSAESPLHPGAWIKVLLPTSNETCIKRWHHGIVSDVTRDDFKVIHVQYNHDSGTHEVVEASLLQFMCTLAGDYGEQFQVVDMEPGSDWRGVVERAREFVGKQDYQLPVRNMERLACYIYCNNTINKNDVDEL